MRIGRTLQFIGTLAITLIIFTGVFAATSTFAALGLARLGINISPYSIYLLSAPFSLLILIAMIIGFGYAMSSRQSARMLQVFGPVIEAMDKIAKGDFTIRIPSQIQDNMILNELVKSVNNMALELDQMEEMRQEFISNVSHEIQSPLTSIRGFTQALQDADLAPEERAHYLTIIETESTRLSRITDNLLKLASLEAKQPKFVPQSYRLDKQIRDLLLACEPQWIAKSIEVDAALTETTIVADEDLLSQVWINLIHNSIRFTPAGGRLCIALTSRDNTIEFRISDTGIGILLDAQPHIFERFYKADKARERSNSGSGLGLSIAKKIIDLHNGTIEVESVPDKGSTFIVQLPKYYEVQSSLTADHA